MVRCIFPKNDQTLYSLELALKKITEKKWPNAEIYLKFHMTYWKYEDTYEAGYHIADNEMIAVHEFIQLFNLT